MESELLAGHPYVIKVEYDLVPKTILGWGLVLKLGYFTIWKKKDNDELRIEKTDDAPENARLMREVYDIPTNPRALAMLQAVRLVAWGSPDITVESRRQVK